MPVPMEKLLNWLNTRTKRELIILLLVSLVITFWLWDCLLAAPLSQKQVAVQQQIADTQAMINKLQTQLALFNKTNNQASTAQLQQMNAQLTKQLLAADQALNQYKQQLIPPQQILSALQFILSASKNLYLLRLENLPALAVNDTAKSNEPLFSHTFVIELRGNYFATLNYLQALEALPWYLYWDDFNYQVVNYPEAKITIKLHILSNQEKLINV